MKPTDLIYFIIIGIVIVYVAKTIAPDHKGEIIHQDTTFVFQIDTVYKTKNIEFKKLDAKIDTIYIDNSQQLIASVDTLISEDSSFVNIRYYFPPLNYFDARFNLKEKIITKYSDRIITKTVIKPETFIDKLGISLQAGVGYGLMYNKVDVYVGFGVHYKLK